jgi:polysaccharide deacetylase family protein (PEP-CTERM system associated)
MNILTFDIEDWWVYDYYGLGDCKEYLPRLEKYLNEILDLLDEKETKATFFCLAKVAEKYPKVVQTIIQRGHHIGCHSYSHKFFGDVIPVDVRNDTRKALDIIQNVIGKEVTAYRAPAFSITESSKWILEILASEGIEYDSSIFPVNRRFGGFENFSPNMPFIIDCNGITIREFPISTAKLSGRDIVYSGGGYFRLFPYCLIKSMTKQSEYMMTYFHIKDFDKRQKRKFVSFYSESAVANYFKSYFGIRNSFSKFKKFVSDFDFMSIEQAANAIDWTKVPSVHI